MKTLLYSFLTCCLVLAPTAYAQDYDRSGPTASDGWEVTLGAGAILAPKYLGADTYGVNAVPSIRIAHGDKFFASVEEGIGYAVIDTESFRAGPLAKIAFGRDEDGSGIFRISGGDTDELIGLGDIDTSIELGGFAELDFGKFTASLRAGQAVSGHDGLVGQVGVRYKDTLRFNGPPLIYSFGPELNFGDATYTNAYFGVNDTQSLASGLLAFEADGGLTSYGVSATAVLPITQNVAVTFISSYNRLAGDAADAPLVQNRGSRDQAFFGTIIGYKFD